MSIKQFVCPIFFVPLGMLSCAGPIIDDSWLYSEESKEESELPEEEEPDPNEEEEEPEEESEEWKDQRPCLRAFRSQGELDERTGGWLSGQYKAGPHGNGVVDAELVAMDGWYEMTGNWSDETNDKAGELYAYMWNDNGEGWLFGWFWSEGTQGRIQATFPWDPDAFSVDGWWSFAQTQLQATARESETGEGTWEGTWLRPYGADMPASGAWGFEDSESGWINGTVKHEGKDRALNGNWAFEEDGESAQWEMVLEDWGIFEGTSNTDGDSSNLRGSGYPFSCQ
jgi:hypothetical protein